jgi:hypothetical protein
VPLIVVPLRDRLGYREEIKKVRPDTCKSRLFSIANILQIGFQKSTRSKECFIIVKNNGYFDKPTCQPNEAPKSEPYLFIMEILLEIPLQTEQCLSGLY